MTIVEKSIEYSDMLVENGISCSDISVAFQEGIMDA